MLTASLTATSSYSAVDFDESPRPRCAPQVLVVDDDAAQRLMARYTLERDGYTVTEARDGEEALAQCADQMPDLILLDAIMPVLNGFEACARLRKLPGGDRVAVLIVTGLDDAQAVDHAFKAGATDFVAKPIHWGVLRRRVCRLVQTAHTQARLDVTEARMRALVASAPDGILTCDDQGIVLTCNPAAERLFGYSAARMIGRPLPAFVAAQDGDELFRDGSGRECIGSRMDGSTFPVEVSLSGFGDRDRRYYSAILRDITERKAVEEKLRLRDRAIEATSQGIVITDSNRDDNPIHYVNAAFEKITGYTQAEVVGRNRRFLQGPETDPAAILELHEAVKGERSCAVELLNYRKDGTPFWVALNISPIHDAAGTVTHFVEVQTDITERKRLEQQFRQAQKMEAVGRLAGGVAHDFNNLLTAILGYGQMLLSGLAADDPLRPGLEEIKKAGERAASLTRQLLAFSRRQVLVPKVLDLNGVVADIQKMLLRVIGEDVELTTLLGGDLASIKADAGQIEQVLMNLAVNSRDAMPHGGRLTIETANVDVTDADARAHADLRPGQYVILTVRDTGSGMDAATKARLFEPFFTTKEVGKGTGLGLATVYGIVQQSGGYITLESAPGCGTTFRIYFPRVDDAVTPQPLNPRTPVAQGRETVLVVEDEPSVRTLVCHVLRRSGYTVLEAANGEEAVMLHDQHPGPVELLVTDMVMPGMSGRQLADRLTGQHQGLKVLYMSGYVDPEGVQATLVKGRRAYLQKPFKPDTLARQVRKVLDQ